MKFAFSLKAVGFTLLAVIIAMAFADNPRQVKKKPTYRGWTKMTESRYGPTVRDDGTTNIQTRAWNSRQRVGKRMGTAKRDWDLVLSPEEINHAFEDAQLIDDSPLDVNAAQSNDVLRELMDYVKGEGINTAL